MPYTENLNNEDQERRFLHLPIRSWKKRQRSRPTEYEKMRLQNAIEEEEKSYFPNPDVLHDYFITRQDHTSDEPCKSPYCGICYDDFIDEFAMQKNISEMRGFKTKLCQSSIKFFEDKYGRDAYQIFRNRLTSNQRYKSSKQNKKSTMKELDKDDVQILVDKFGGYGHFANQSEYL